MAFFHLVDRRKRQGFPGSTAAASCGGDDYEPTNWPQDWSREGLIMPREPAYDDERSLEGEAKSASE